MAAAVAVLGAGAYLAHAIYAQPPKAPPRNPTAEEDYALGLDRPEVLLMQNAQVAGMIAPQYQAATVRKPWNTGSAAPYYIHRPGQSHLDSPVTQLYTQILNATYHNRQDFQEQFAASRQQYARKSAQPVYTGFTDEMCITDSASGKKRYTQHMQWSWLPSNPTDSDFNDAALMAKAVPPDPLLFTPDANFATAPGLPFRYQPQE